jgi:helix-turn-helix protein
MSKKKESEALVSPVSVSLPKNYNIEQAAEYLGCKAHWLRLEIKAGNITPLLLGHRYIFPEEELLRYRSQTAQEAGCMAAVR